MHCTVLTYTRKMTPMKTLLLLGVCVRTSTAQGSYISLELWNSSVSCDGDALAITRQVLDECVDTSDSSAPTSLFITCTGTTCIGKTYGTSECTGTEVPPTITVVADGSCQLEPFGPNSEDLERSLSSMGVIFPAHRTITPISSSSSNIMAIATFAADAFTGMKTPVGVTSFAGTNCTGKPQTTISYGAICSEYATDAYAGYHCSASGAGAMVQLCFYADTACTQPTIGPSGTLCVDQFPANTCRSESTGNVFMHC